MAEGYNALNPDENIDLEDGLPDSVVYNAPDGRTMEASRNGDEYIVNEFGETWNDGELQGRRTEVDMDDLDGEQDLYEELDSVYESSGSQGELQGDVQDLVEHSDLDPV